MHSDNMQAQAASKCIDNSSGLNGYSNPTYVSPCPTCGRCPTCGTYKPQVQPYIGYPYCGQSYGYSTGQSLGSKSSGGLMNTPLTEYPNSTTNFLQKSGY